MGLADDVRAAQVAPHISPIRSAPSGFEPGVRYEAGEPVEVTVQVTEIPEDEAAWRAEIKRVTTLDIPEARRVEIQQVRYWGNPEQPLVYVRFGIRDRESVRADGDLPGLVRVVRGNRRRPTKATASRTRVVVVSDAQVGKVDHRGGTPAFLARVEQLLAGLEVVMRQERCEDALVLDPGDLTEGFENTGSQLHTDDLSLPDQLDLAQVVLTEIVSMVAAKHTWTRVATVPSNHGAWRRGKDRLGRPGDDFGILTHKTVARAMRMAGRDDVTFVIPDPWVESLALQVRGAVVGMAHGHQANTPDRLPDWWAKQTHGGGPLAAASILVSGHFHHLRVQPSGAIDGKARWWMQAPTLDNGSAWWANGQGGADVEAGLLTFTVDDQGRWDGLRLITE